MKNEFSNFLKDLIKTGGIKNNTIAQATGYDLSYISKWLSGAMLPSEKSINNIADKIASCIYPEIKKSGQCAQLLGNIDSPVIISEAILQAYYASKGNNTSAIKNEFYAEISNSELYDLIVSDIDTSPFSILVTDFFSLDMDTRLLISGIKNGSFVEKRCSGEKELIITINPIISQDYIHNGISLIHLISGLSRYNLSMYAGEIAANKLIYIGGIVATGVVLSKGSSRSSVVSIVGNLEEKKKLLGIIRMSFHTNDKVFNKFEMSNFVNERYYLKSMLSTNIRWLLGHITELIMPDELFVSLAKRFEIDDQEHYRLHDFAKSIIEQETTSILVYETAISDFVATGEIDFFNHKVVLSVSEIDMFMEYLNNIMRSNNFRLIRGAFFSEYEHVFNPALYISDTVCYIRCENAYERENVYQIISDRIKELIDELFKGIWFERPDVVISDKKIIGERICHFMELTNMIS